MSATRCSCRPAPRSRWRLTVRYAEACGSPADNLVLKAARRLPRGSKAWARPFRSHKELPVAAGIGGGSADAAAALRLLVARQPANFCQRRFADARLRERRSTSAPTCRSVSNRARASCAASARVAGPARSAAAAGAAGQSGRGAGDARRVRPACGGKAAQPRPPRCRATRAALIEWLAAHGNDLTEPAIACVPVIAEVLQRFGRAAGRPACPHVGLGADLFCAVCARRRGRGGGAAAARPTHRDWWIHAATMLRWTKIALEIAAMLRKVAPGDLRLGSARAGENNEIEHGSRLLQSCGRSCGRSRLARHQPRPSAITPPRPSTPRPAASTDR